MTTGRINQVTTLHARLDYSEAVMPRLIYSPAQAPHRGKGAFQVSRPFVGPDCSARLTRLAPSRERHGTLSTSLDCQRFQATQPQNHTALQTTEAAETGLSQA